MQQRAADLVAFLDRRDDEFARLIRDTDWSTTPLGALEGWPRRFASYVMMILELPSPAIVFWGPEQTQIYNEGYAQIMGPRHPRYFGAPLRECWPDTYPVVHPWMRKVLDTGEAIRVERSHIPVTRYGFDEDAYFTFTFSPLRDDHGEIAGIYQPIVEVTDVVLSERRAETLRALAPRPDSSVASRDVIDALAANSDDIPFALLYLWSETEEALELCAASDELPGGPDRCPDVVAAAFETGASLDVDVARDLLGADDRGSFPAIPSAQVLPLPERASAPRGAIVLGVSPRLHFDARYRSFFDAAAGQIATALGSARSLQEAKKRADALAAIDRARTTFLSNVSHEFRTPLTLMLGPLDDVLAEPDRAPSRENLETVRRNANRLLDLVNTLLDFSRIEAGRAAASYQPTDLSAVTVELASAFRSATESAGLRFELDCPPLGDPIYVDRDMWEKIVVNLVSNAFKFTFEGGIDVSLRREGDLAVLRVEDTGVGLADSQVPGLFQPFNRPQNARARSQQGSGIGLALVRELVKLHGGVIEVESSEGVGTTFTVRLPVGSAHLPVKQVGGAPASSAATFGAASFLGGALRRLPSSPAGPPHQPPRPTRPNPVADILVVDDDEDMREYLQRLLATRWSVDTAEDGVAALAAARARPPRLVLTDVMMPRMDGFGLLEALRADERTRMLPVVLLSARAGEEARIEGLAAGADDYLVKPFSTRELLARVESQLELSRLRTAAELERKKLHDLFMRAPAMICVLGGPEHVFELANPLYQQVVGHRPLVGRTIREALPELEGQGFFELLDEVYRSGVPCAFNETLVKVDRDGDGRLDDAFLNFLYQPSFDADGAVDGIVVFAFEVTEEVRARQQVQDVQNRMSFALEAAGVGFWDFDLATQATSRSPSHDRIFGYDSPLDEWNVGKFLSHVVEGDRERARESLERSQRTGEDWLIECRIVRADGVERWIAAHGRIEASPAGVPLRMLGIVLDITERKLAEADHEERLADLARTVRFSELFVGIVGHDLRSPLAAIMAAAEVVKMRAGTSEDVATPAARIIHSAEHMRRIIDQLLDFTRIRLGGGLPLQRSTTDLGELCRRAIDDLDEGRGATLTLETSGATVGQWDPDRLAQMISNLLGNALEHGVRDAPVAIRVEGTERDTVRLEIRNQGVIPADLLPVIFEPFRRGPPRKGASGLGLGLFITQQIALALGGSIEVESSEHDGTRFLVELPRGH